jgi:hypothetical protein
VLLLLLLHGLHLLHVHHLHLLHLLLVRLPRLLLLLLLLHGLHVLHWHQPHLLMLLPPLLLLLHAWQPLTQAARPAVCLQHACTAVHHRLLLLLRLPGVVATAGGSCHCHASSRHKPRRHARLMLPHLLVLVLLLLVLLHPPVCHGHPRHLLLLLDVAARPHLLLVPRVHALQLLATRHTQHAYLLLLLLLVLFGSPSCYCVQRGPRTKYWIICKIQDVIRNVCQIWQVPNVRVKKQGRFSLLLLLVLLPSQGRRVLLLLQLQVLQVLCRLAGLFPSLA